MVPCQGRVVLVNFTQGFFDDGGNWRILCAFSVWVTSLMLITGLAFGQAISGNIVGAPGLSIIFGSHAA